MAKRIVRKFEAYALHAHHDTPATYIDLFERLAKLPRGDRLFKFSDDLITGIPIIEEDAGRYFFQIVESSDGSALVLNVDTGRTRENILAESEVLSHATHVVVDPAKRRAAVEFVHRGAKATLISATIEGVLRTHYKDLSDMRFEMAPVIRKNFVTEINSFERIREASLRVTRPNASWTDRYTELSNFMEESNGDKVEVGIKAKRNQSLSKNTGVVGVIKEVVADQQPYLDDAKVVGNRKNEENETTIHAKKHVLHTRQSVTADDAGVPDANDIKAKLNKFLSSL